MLVLLVLLIGALVSILLVAFIMAMPLMGVTSQSQSDKSGDGK